MNEIAPRDPVQDAVDLLDTVADRAVDHAIADIEGIAAKLRQHADEATTARDTLGRTPVDVLRAAMRVRAARPRRPEGDPR